MIDQNTPYRSLKAALAAAANYSSSLGFPAGQGPRVQTSRDPDRGDHAIAVRAALTRCGIDPDDAEVLFAWATIADDALDNDLGAASDDDAHREALAASQVRADRLAELRNLVTPALRAAGLIPARRIALHRVGYRVLEHAGMRTAHMVLDPDPADATILAGPGCQRVAAEIVAGIRTGPVVQADVLRATPRRRPDLAAEFLERWERGEFECLTSLDQAIRDRIDCSMRHASRVRATWGVSGRAGRAPTRPPGYQGEGEA